MLQHLPFTLLARHSVTVGNQFHQRLQLQSGQSSQSTPEHSKVSIQCSELLQQHTGFADVEEREDAGVSFAHAYSSLEEREDAGVSFAHAYSSLEEREDAGVSFAHAYSSLEEREDAGVSFAHAYSSLDERQESSFASLETRIVEECSDSNTPRLGRKAANFKVQEFENDLPYMLTHTLHIQSTNTRF
ncbi:hypothetical protein BT96DRAFT_978152 [Gymnopus androsaceus JB14]|uniref:Uncharacterized protein n=1 Tax=Gymnopus androsaceus JB14 TaxID=1447944 RepID=A0A6A4HBW1_9AGAR|nr:hypothetical protein BT96DRAFT_978152 [Gymnopus androsaceus JB14]